MSVSKIKIDGIIGEEGTIEGEDFNYFSADNMRDFLSEPATQSAEVIEVDLATAGGDVEHGLAIYDMLIEEKRKGKKIRTVGRQFDSIGSVIFSAGDEREAVTGSIPLIHNAWLSPSDLHPETELNAQTLELIAKENAFADSQIMGVYANVIPRDKLNEVKELVENSTQLTDDQLTDLGLATKIIDGKARNQKLKPIAFNTRNNKISNQNQIEMAIEKEHVEKLGAVEGKIDTLLASVKNFFSPSAKAMSLPLEDGGTLEIEMADGEDPVGKPAFTVNEAGERIPAEAGEYRSGNTVYVVSEANRVETVMEGEPAAMSEEEKIEKAVAEAVAKSKAEGDHEKEQALSALRAEKEEEMKALQANSEKALNDIKAEFKALKKNLGMVEGDSADLSEEEKLKNLKEEREKFKAMKPSERRQLQLKNQLAKQG